MPVDDPGHVIFRQDGKTKITIDCRTGEVRFAEGMTPNEGAIFFWTHVSKLAKASWDAHEAAKLLTAS